MARSGRLHKTDPRADTLSDMIEKGENEKVKQLLSEVGIDACDSSLRTAVLWAAFHNNKSLLTWVIEKGANINHQDRNRHTALHFAGQQKHVDCAKLLIDKGANLELTDLHGNTALFAAIFNSRGEYGVVTLYVKHGATLDHVNNHGMSPRTLAETISGFDLNSIKSDK